MKIGLIGTINKDSISLADGTDLFGWGGILYNLATYDLYAEKDLSIVPVCNIGRDCYGEIMKIIDSFKAVDPKYLKIVAEPNNHCYLIYTNAEDKSETLLGGVPRLKFNDFEPLLDCDIVHLNFISGRDVYLSSMRKFRSKYDGKIYVDIHSLTLGKRSDGRRYLRRPKSWIDYFELADYIQINKLEAGLIAQNDKTGTIDPHDSIRKLYSLLKEKRVDISRKSIIVTDGSSGCHVAYYDNGKALINNIKPEIVHKNGNTTGCGDCFGAGFVLGLARGQSLAQSAKLANRAASGRIGPLSPDYNTLS